MLNSTYISLSTKQGRINPQACEWLNMQSGVIEVLVPDIPKSCELRGCPNNCRIWAAVQSSFVGSQRWGQAASCWEVRTTGAW